MDANTLSRENAHLKARLAEVEGALAEVQEANRRLEGILRAAQRDRFGKSSEKLSPDQFNLPLEDAELAQGVLEAAQEKAEAALARARGDEPRKPARNRGHLPPDLPRVERVIEPASTLCPCGCGEMARIGEDVFERLDVIPAQFQVLVTRRPRYACRRCSQAVVQAHAPEHVVPGGLPTERLIAWIIVSKFGDHLPFYRQAGIFERQGLHLDRGTLGNWVGRAFRGLRGPTGATVPSSPPAACDRPHKGPSARRRPHFRRRDPRAGAGPGPEGHQERLLLGRRLRRPRPWRCWSAHRAVPLRTWPWTGASPEVPGRIPRPVASQCDAYQSYNALTEITRDEGPWQLVYCWTHVRRRFVKRLEREGSPIAEEMLRQIALLYRIETTVRGHAPANRLAARRKHATPIIAALKPWLETQLSRIPQKSLLAEDIRYTLGHWSGLIRFLDDGALELDTNPVENQIRPIALTRKNALFAGNEIGAENWAMLASLVATCKLSGVNPVDYLADTLQAILDGHPKSHIEDLMPWR